MGEPHPDMMGRPGTGFVGSWILGRRHRTGMWTGEVGDKKLSSLGSSNLLLLRCVRKVSTWAATSGVVSKLISL